MTEVFLAGRRVGFAFLLGILLVTGCTSGPELQKYPRTQIERPYTLPKGVATWKTIVPVGFLSDNTGSSFIPPIPVPLFWQSSLSDDWTLNWVPIPLSISHQFSYSKEQVWGATFGAGFGYASSIGAVIAPALSLYQRTKLGTNWALETTPSFSAQYQTIGDPWEWTAGLSSGPMFQLTDTFALIPKVGISVEYGYRNVLVVSNLSVQPQKTTQVTVPLSLTAEWSIDRQWDLDATYSYYGIGYANGYTAHIGWVSLTHFW